jgi:hypothetical protein
MDSADPFSGSETGHEKNQEVLSTLLSTDLELAYTFLEVAQVTGDSDHRSATIEHAKNALDAIRKLFRLVEDPGARRGFEKRAGKLQTAINQVEKAREKLPVGSFSPKPH